MFFWSIMVFVYYPRFSFREWKKKQGGIHETHWITKQFAAHFCIPSWEPTYPLPKVSLKIIFLFKRWDILVPWRVCICIHIYHILIITHHHQKKTLTRTTTVYNQKPNLSCPSVNPSTFASRHSEFGDQEEHESFSLDGKSRFRETNTMVSDGRIPSKMCYEKAPNFISQAT